MTSSNGNIFRVTGHLCGEFTGHRWIPAQRPVTRSFDVFFDLRLNKRLSKQSWGWRFETLSHPLWRHFNVLSGMVSYTCVVSVCMLDKNHKYTVTFPRNISSHKRNYSRVNPVLCICNYTYLIGSTVPWLLLASNNPLVSDCCLLTCNKVNYPIIDEYLHPLKSVAWYYLSIP